VTLSTRANFLATVVKSKEWRDTEKEDEEKAHNDKQSGEGAEVEKNGKENNVENVATTEEEEQHETEKDPGHEDESDNEEASTEKRAAVKNPKMTGADFTSQAKDIIIHGFDKEIVLKPREFPKSFGWFATGKSKRTLGTEDLKVQMTLTLHVINSGKWKEE